MGHYFSDKSGKGLRILLDENMCSIFDSACTASIQKYFGRKAYVVELGDVASYGIPDDQVYDVASRNKFDLIFTRDAKMADVGDLCSVANEAFVGRQDNTKRVPLVVFNRRDVTQTLRDNHRDVMSLGWKRDYAILDTRNIRASENLTGTHRSIADFWMSGGQSIHHNAYR